MTKPTNWKYLKLHKYARKELVQFRHSESEFGGFETIFPPKCLRVLAKNGSGALICVDDENNSFNSLREPQKGVFQKIFIPKNDPNKPI